MDARQIHEMRALLAAQTAQAEARPAGFTRRLSRLLAPRPSPWTATDLAAGAAPAPIEPFDAEALDDGPLVLELAPPTPIPPGILLGDLAPRRAAFGQRAEPVLELEAPAPLPAQRLTLMAPDGAAVGEIILNASDLNGLQARRAAEPQHCETPFFPEDLADEPGLRRPVAKAKPMPAPSPPTPELAATFLLATLAARLASEEVALRDRLEAVSILAEAA